MNIFKLFNKAVSQETKQKEIDNSDEYSYQSESSNLQCLGTKLRSDKKSSMYYGNARLIVNNISNWCFNRKVNETHVQVLTNSLKSQTLLIGTLIFVGNRKTGEIVLIDGFHRVCSIRNLCKDINFNLHAYSLVYFVDDLDELEINQLFIKVNNCLNFETHDLPDEKILKCVNLIKKKYATCIKKTKIVHKPHVNEDTLLKGLKQSKLCDTDLTYIEIVDKFSKLNSKYANMSVEEIFGKKSEPNINYFKKAQIKGFYIGLISCDSWSIELVKM